MASNSQNNADDHSCRIGPLSGQFVNPTDEAIEPIMDLVKAAGVKFLPRPWDQLPKDIKDLRMRDLWSEMDVHWNSKMFINFKRDDIVERKGEEAKRHERATKAEDDASIALR